MDLLLLLSSLIFCGICSTLAIGVYTPKSLVVKEGMELRLDCKLEYQTDIQQHNIKLEWLHSSDSDTEEVLIFFHYQNLSVIAQETVFFPRLQWVGDIGQSNGSILITDVECSDSGYFTCDMRIPRSSSGIYRSRIDLTVLCEDPAGEINLFTNHQDTERYVTVTNRNPRQIERQNKVMDEVISKDSKTGEEETYVTMHSILRVKTPDDLPKPIVVNAPVPGEHPHPVLSTDFLENHRKF
ncbi:hypothetical protein chiPu_0004648 [Chiloscyllium punctatum]|uniref:Ig-like domain-containing protein n=1 Tax=Chiloscyllium punctatum TaxID=137246 RepID=A0A401S759_CHIPU|nr:hypothetical protein [Chiloscyllium punctatum]